MRTTRVHLWVLLTGLLVLTAGCTGSSGSSGSAAPSGSPSPAAGSSAPAVAASASPGATASALPVLAQRDGSSGGTALRVELNELRVSGQVTTLTFTLRNSEPEDGSGRFQIAGLLSDGVYQMKSGGSQYAQDADSADGVYLLDTAGAKRYLPARTASKACVCSTDLGSTFVDPGNGVALSDVFAALPANVTAVDVVVPHFGTFSAVPVSR